jgi:hypothetical protein
LRLTELIEQIVHSVPDSSNKITESEDS